jgi:transcriptional regulator with XRE-family HTH domain
MNMQSKPLFGDLIAGHDGLAEELKAVDVAADLTLLLHHAGQSRADLARALGWSRSRVTQVLSCQENLTVQTIAAVSKALGYTFDVAFRKSGASAVAQPWKASPSTAPDSMNAPAKPLLLAKLPPPVLNFQDLAAPRMRKSVARSKVKRAGLVQVA